MNIILYLLKSIYLNLYYKFKFTDIIIILYSYKVPIFSDHNISFLVSICAYS